MKRKKNTAYDCFHGNGPNCKIPTKKEPIQSDSLLIQFFKSLVCMFLFIPAISATCIDEIFSTRVRGGGGGGGGNKIDVGVRFASQNPCLICEKICDIRYPIYDLTKNLKPF